MVGMEQTSDRNWIEEEEFEDANIKWGFSHFAGLQDTFNDEGDHNFMIILDEERAKRMMAEGWSIKVMEGREEGDPPEYLLKVKISYRFEAPPIFFLKGARRFRADEADLADIKRASCEQIDVIVSPKPWIHGKDSGVSAYVKEMYVQIRESRFGEKYRDYEEVK